MPRLPGNAVRRNKTPPILSQEFFIKNHGDIAGCVCIVAMLAFMFQSTQPLAAKVISMNYNVSGGNSSADDEGVADDVVRFRSGWLDVLNIIFYTLIFIIVHDAVQEYVVDKCTKKYHMSKTKLSKFTESSHLVLFTIISTAAACRVVSDVSFMHSFPDIQYLWTRYPHQPMEWILKFYLLTQVAYWLHLLPELWIRKVKQEEWPDRIVHYSLYVIGIAGGYFLSLAPLVVLLLILHYSCEAVFHLARLGYLMSKNSFANVIFGIWKIWFVMCRLATVIVSVLTIWFRLPGFSSDVADVETGNFNTPAMRLAMLVYIILSQAWLMWLFVNFEMKYRRARSEVRNQLKKAQELRKNLLSNGSAAPVSKKKNKAE